MWDSGFGGRLDDLGVGIWRGKAGESNDEELLAFESGNDARLVTVVDGDRFDARWELILTALARQGGDGVLARLDKGCSKWSADLAARLFRTSAFISQRVFSDDE